MRVQVTCAQSRLLATRFTLHRWPAACGYQHLVALDAPTSSVARHAQYGSLNESISSSTSFSRRDRMGHSPNTCTAAATA